MEKVLISVDELEHLKACENTLYFYHRFIQLCPVCKRGMLCDGNVCTHCGYDGSDSVE